MSYWSRNKWLVYNVEFEIFFGVIENRLDKAYFVYKV